MALLRGIFASVMLISLASATIHSQEHQTAQENETSRKSKNEHIFVPARTAELANNLATDATKLAASSRSQKDLATVQKQLRTIHEDIERLDKSVFANTPIKIGGGSMTFRYQIAGGATGSNTTPPVSNCSNVDTTLASIRDDEDELIPLNIPASGVWVMKLYGRTPDGNSSSNRGIELDATDSSCNGMKGYSVTMKLFDDTNTSTGQSKSGFYPNDGVVDPDPVTGKRRFRDLDDVGCSGPNAGNGDEDICERMYEVRVWDSKHNPVVKQPCKHGECVVFIGK